MASTTAEPPRVKLQNQSNQSEMVIFNVSPELSESRAINYTPLEPVHSPGQMMIYKNTQARTFELSDVKFISRSREEASANLKSLQMIRSWTLPWFGKGSASASGSSGSIGSGINSAGGGTSSGNANDNDEGPPETERATTADNSGINNRASEEVEEVTESEIFAAAIPNNFNFTQAGSAALNSVTSTVNSGIATARSVLSSPSAAASAATAAVSRLSGGLGGSGASGSSGSGGSNLGAPPAVLYLSAYSNGGQYTNINKIPVVMTNLSIQYPTDVDYIPSSTGEPFPTIMSISMSLTESHSPVEYEGFSLADFKAGKLTGF